MITMMKIIPLIALKIFFPSLPLTLLAHNISCNSSLIRNLPLTAYKIFLFYYDGTCQDYCDFVALLTYILIYYCLQSIQFTLISFTDFILFFFPLLFFISRNARIVLRENEMWWEEWSERSKWDIFDGFLRSMEAHFLDNCGSKALDHYFSKPKYHRVVSLPLIFWCHENCFIHYILVEQERSQEQN